MRVLTYNILDGGVGRADPIGEVIEAQQADVVVLIEADDVEVVDRIANRLRMDVIHAPGHRHAAAILSRWPIMETVNHALRLSDGPRSCGLRSCVEAIVQSPSGDELPIVAVHLHAGAHLADERQRLRQLDRLLEFTANHRQANCPHLLAGDFNSNAPTQKIAIDRCKPKTREAYAANGNRIPRDVIERLLSEGYVDTLHAFDANAADTTATFTTHEPAQRVDYVFSFGIDRSRIRHAWIEHDRLATFASDHYPAGAEFDV